GGAIARLTVDTEHPEPGGAGGVERVVHNRVGVGGVVVVLRVVHGDAAPVLRSATILHIPRVSKRRVGGRVGCLGAEVGVVDRDGRACVDRGNRVQFTDYSVVNVRDAACGNPNPGDITRRGELFVVERNCHYAATLTFQATSPWKSQFCWMRTFSPSPYT